MKQIRIPAKTEKLEEVLAFVNTQLEQLDCPMKIQTQLDIAVEEIFVNIAHYAYPEKDGEAYILLEITEEPISVRITFIDNGKPYDPLAREDPDVTLSAEERQIGGLGIYMVKKSMDAVNYEYKNGQNILTIQRNIE